MVNTNLNNTETDLKDTLGSVSTLEVGIKACCPSCGKGKLFKGVLTLNEECPACGFDMRDADPADGPAIFVMFILGAIVVIGAFILEFKYNAPVWLHVVLWPVVIFGGTIWMLRVLKGWMVASQFKHDAKEGILDEETDDE